MSKIGEYVEQQVDLFLVRRARREAVRRRQRAVIWEDLKRLLRLQDKIIRGDKSDD